MKGLYLEEIIKGVHGKCRKAPKMQIKISVLTAEKLKQGIFLLLYRARILTDMILSGWLWKRAHRQSLLINLYLRVGRTGNHGYRYK